MQTIIVKTLFDITATNVIKPYSRFLVEKKFPDFNTPELWKKARNQQQNWETLIQIISLRAQPFSIIVPIKSREKIDSFGYDLFEGFVWTFSFKIENDMAYQENNNPVQLLINDCNNVPMNIKLDEDTIDCNYCKSVESIRNIQFKLG